ncbi:MAG: hypothetical protein ACOVN5_06945 [Aquidulcibacter sp.]
MTVVTTSMVKEIRRLRARGLSYRKIAARVRVSAETAWKYASDENEALARAKDAEMWQRTKQDPELLEMHRAAVRANRKKRRSMAIELPGMRQEN